MVATSATIGEGDAKYLGMEIQSGGEGEEDMTVDDPGYSYFEVSKSFPASRRPLVYCKLTPPIRMDYRTTDGEKRLFYRAVDSYISCRIHQKGIIHTRSYDRVKEVLSMSSWSDFMITHRSAQDLDRAVQTFKSAPPPCILVSPSIEEGWDFPGEECRWGVVLKVPFVYGGDPLMKARSAEDKEYKNHLARHSLIQMVGRGTRFAQDWCQMVIFDSHWGWFGSKMDWPKWFEEGFQYVGGLGEVPVMDLGDQEMRR